MFGHLGGVKEKRHPGGGGVVVWAIEIQVCDMTCDMV